MAELTNGIDKRVSKGDHVYTVELNGGTAELQYYVSDGITKTVPDSNTETDGSIVQLKAGLVKAVVTGGARVWLSEA